MKNLVRAIPAPRGFTLVELLVVIAIIGALTALALSGIQGARGAARRAQCSNQMKQIALGIINYESTHQNFPGYVQSLGRAKQQGQASGQKDYLLINFNGLTGSRMQSTQIADESRVSWAAMVLNEIEQRQVYDNMMDGTIPSTDDRALIRPVEAYICPDDVELSTTEGSAGLSYSANTGTWDWYTPGGQLGTNFNRASFLGIKGDYRANGIFHDRGFGKVKMDSGDVSKGDGAENTILLAENFQKEDDYTWAGVGANMPAEQQLGVVWLDPAQHGGGDRDWNPFLSGGPAMQPFSVEGDTSGYVTTTPQYARPSSGHAGAFNVAMASGSVRTIATTIDYSVYQRLLTVQGSKSVEPVNHDPSAFRTLPPLAAGDY